MRDDVDFFFFLSFGVYEEATRLSSLDMNCNVKCVASHNGRVVMGRFAS